MATTRLELERLVSEAIGDYREFDTSTNVAASVTVISTTLRSYDGGQDDYFSDWWVSFQEGNNAAVAPRQVSAYTTSSGQLTLRGANLTAETAAVTVRLHRYDPQNKWNAINRALEQVYPVLYKPLDDQTLVGNNILPNAHFEDWASTAKPDFWETSNVSATVSAGTALFRGANKAVKLTATAANGVLIMDSDNYPPLLDLMDRTVNFYAWAYPEVADDAFLTIYTLQAAGSTQTLSSLTTCPATKWTLLKLEDQKLNDDLVKVEVRLRVVTDTKYVIFDDAVLCNGHRNEYVMPSELQQAFISQVRVQSQGYSDVACYDIHPQYWRPQEDFEIIRTGDYDSTAANPVYDRLKLLWFPESYRRLRLTGYAPLGTMSSDTSTIWIDGERLNLIVAKAARILYGMERGAVSSEDKSRYNEEIGFWDNEVRRLTPALMMQRPPGRLMAGK